MKLTINKAKAKRFEFVLKDEDNEVIDLTGITGKLKVYLDIPGLNDTFVIDKALTLSNAEQGECYVELDNTETDFEPAIYNYLVEFHYATDDDRVLDSGSFEIVGDDTTRINEIKTLYGLKYDYLTMQSALNYAHKRMLDNAFLKLEQDFSSAKSEFKIDNYVMDSNFDGTVDKTDLQIQEFMKNSPYTVNDLSANISSVIFSHPNGKTIITMDAEYPTTDYTMRITYYQGVDTYSNLNESIKKAEELYTILRLFDILEPYKLQHGLTNKSINGVDIVFDREGINDYKKQLSNQIQNELIKIKGITGTNILISKGY